MGGWLGPRLWPGDDGTGGSVAEPGEAEDGGGVEALGDGPARSDELSQAARDSTSAKQGIRMIQGRGWCTARSYEPFFALMAAVISGRTFSASPTMPRSAYWKMGASLSLLMAMIRLDVFIPTRCWMAPEMPTAM